MTECVVCLENKDSVYNINDIACIKKTCKCEYFCHIECVKDWIYDNPSCLLCGTLMYIDDNIDLKYRYIRPVDDIKVQNIPIVPYTTSYYSDNVTHNRDNIHVNSNSYSPPPAYDNVVTSPLSSEQQSEQNNVEQQQNSSNIDIEIENSVDDQLYVIQDECSMTLCCQYIVCVCSIFFIIIISSNLFQ